MSLDRSIFNQNINNHVFLRSLEIESQILDPNPEINLQFTRNLINQLSNSLETQTNLSDFVRYTSIVPKSIAYLSQIEDNIFLSDILKLIIVIVSRSSESIEMFTNDDIIAHLIPILQKHIIDLTVLSLKLISKLSYSSLGRCHIISTGIIPVIIEIICEKVKIPSLPTYEDVFESLSCIRVFLHNDKENIINLKIISDLLIELSNSANFYRISSHYFELLYEFYSKTNPEILIQTNFLENSNTFLFSDRYQNSIKMVSKIISSLAFDNPEILLDFANNLDIDALANKINIEMLQQKNLTALIIMISNLAFLQGFPEKILQSERMHATLMELYESVQLRGKIELINLLWALVLNTTVENSMNYITNDYLQDMMDIFNIDDSSFEEFIEQKVIPYMKALSVAGFFTDEKIHIAKSVLEEVVLDPVNDKVLEMAQYLLSSVFNQDENI